MESDIIENLGDQGSRTSQGEVPLSRELAREKRSSGCLPHVLPSALLSVAT